MRHVALRGKDLHAPSNEIVENNTGSTIGALKVVALNGYGTKFPQIQLANPNLYPNFGVCYEDIESGKTGLVCCLGFIYEIDTSLLAVNDLLYSDVNGNLTTTPLGDPVAIVVKSHPTQGIIRVFIAGVNVGSTIGWDLDGNAGTDPNVNFLGTTDNKPLIIRTNNQFKATITESGRFGLGVQNPDRHFHIKSHVSNNASGYQLETFYVESSVNSFVMAYNLTIPNPGLVRVEFVAIARQTDGAERAMFKRTGLFYREGGNVQAQGPWLSDQTIKSNNLFDVSYTMGLSTVSFNVKNATNTLTRWTGHIKIEVLT